MNQQSLLEIVGAALHWIAITQSWYECTELKIKLGQNNNTYQNHGEEYEGDEYWFDVGSQEIISLLVFDGFGQRVQSLLIEYFLDQVITRGVEEDGDKEHHKEHTEDYHAVETEQMDRGAKLEGHHAEPK